MTRVLLVEDSAMKALAFRRFLEHLGAVVVHVTTLDAVPLLGDFDAVATDLWFPSEPGAPQHPNGWALIVECRARELPCLVVSGDAPPRDWRDTERERWPGLVSVEDFRWLLSRATPGSIESAVRRACEVGS